MTTPTFSSVEEEVEWLRKKLSSSLEENEVLRNTNSALEFKQN